ncbi:hypothetical protein Psal160_01316 [Piscirickettsia salmonis]|nr:hypothetical protein Psal160_01316 [Piscirickettsia salmonis]
MNLRFGASYLVDDLLSNDHSIGERGSNNLVMRLK